MNKLTEVFVGVDVSKDTLDMYIVPFKKGFHFQNNSQGVQLILQQLESYEVKRIALEATGGYENLLYDALEKDGFKPWRVEPSRIRSFIKARGIKAKTDAIDAKMIAYFTEKFEPDYDPIVKSADQKTLKILVRRKEDLQNMAIMEKQRKKSPGQTPCLPAIQRHIDFLEDEIEEVEKQIQSLIDANKEMHHKRELMISIPGISVKTAASLLGELPELGKLENKKIASLAGLAPYTKKSGNFVGNAKPYGGRELPRKALYMGTLSAIRCNLTFKNFYERLRTAGKKPKVAIVAVMRKIIIVLNVMLKKNEGWRLISSPGI